ncbi:acyl-[acyl-carrier-protein] thioesterase [Alkalibaculum bacchi]|uniref:acyl-[acyl-carrier-protein] thioesterase n=1 Tax=Alkalibaculum bacchi TaxID=645887 RepID=UPI0026EBD988|nr:acyl-ACP thioesterase domain-containing protein [Alkalibaculum bacchi]
MSGIITTKEYLVQSYEVDSHYNIFPEVILNYLQDTAMVQSEKIGMGIEYLKKSQLIWVLTRYHIKIMKYPKHGETVRVSTYAVGFNKVFAYRDFKIENLKGETLITAKSQWLLIDGKSHKMLKIGDEFYKAYGIDKGSKISVYFDKLTIPEKYTFTRNFRADRRDIDFNGHVNNTRYIAWALDATPQKVLRDYNLCEFDIVFKKEVFLDQSIAVMTDITDLNNRLKGCHEIKNDQGETVCCINAIWKSAV